jgi:hypothetical protein
VRLRMCGGSRRCCGSEESDNDARVWVICSVAVAAFSGHRTRVEEKDREGNGERERERE